MPDNVSSELASCVSDPKQAHRLLESFSKIVDVINTKKLNYETRLDKILKIILEYLGVEQGSIMILEGQNLVVRAASRPELLGVRQSIKNHDKSVAAWVAYKRKPLFIPDISQNDLFDRKWRDGDTYKKKSLLSVPIVHQDRVIGIINATDKIGDRDLLQQDIARLFDLSGLILSLVVQQNLQDEVRKQRNTLRKRNKELRHQQAVRADLSKMLIHDLKGPLSEVVANLDILSYTISEENKEFLEAAEMGCNRAVRMISNLVDIDKIEEGRMQLIKEVVAPDSILEESQTSIIGLAKIRKVDLVMEQKESLPSVMADRVLILRVMQNLLVNALGYSPPDTVITFGCRLVGKKKLEFYVQDQGEGMPVEKQKTIFDKYTRISDKQDALVGTGLGLYFCKLAVEEHKGKIGVESSVGKGSRFFFSLPK